MAVTTVNLTGDIADLLGGDFDSRRTKVWIETNVDGDVVIDSENNKIRLGDAKADVGTDGTFAFTGLVATNSTTNPTGFQYRVWVDYATRRPAGPREKWNSGWFSLTATLDLADVVAEQYVPPTYLTTVTQQLDAKVAEAAASAQLARDISNIDAPDALVKTLIEDSGSATAGALSASTAGMAVTVVNHGTTAGTARPTGAVRVLWRGTATPSNGAEGDDWENTLTGARYSRRGGAWVQYGGTQTPAKVQQAVHESGATTTRTATLASTPTEGNLLVAICLIRSGNTAAQVTGPAGYTEVVMTGTAANNARIGVWVKEAGAAESPSVTVTVANSTGVYLVLTEWSGVTSTVDVVHAGNTGSSNATSRTLGPASTTTQENDLALAYVGSSSTLGTLGAWSDGFTQEGTAASHAFASKVISSPTEPTTSLSWATARIVSGVLVTFKAKRVVSRAPVTTRPVRSKFDPVAEFGAAGDGTTDDTSAVAAAVAAAKAVGGEVYFSKICRTSSPLAISGTMTLRGASRACGIVNGASDLFQWSGYGVRVESLLLRSEPGGGHIFDQVGSTNSCNFIDIEADQQNADKSVYRHINDLGNYLFNTWAKSRIKHVRTGTTPTIYFKPLTGSGATNANLFERIEMLNPSGAYGFHLESARDLNYLYNMTLRDITWEIPAGGCVKALGCNTLVLDQHDIYDLTIQQATSHLFYFGQGTHATNPAPNRNLQIKGLRHHGPVGSELAAGIKHIYMESGKVPNAHVENVRHNVTDNMLADYGSNSALEVASPYVTRTNANGVVRVNSADGTVLHSPDGTAYKLTVANGGALTTTAV